MSRAQDAEDRHTNSCDSDLAARCSVCVAAVAYAWSVRPLYPLTVRYGAGAPRISRADCRGSVVSVTEFQIWRVRHATETLELRRARRRERSVQHTSSTARRMATTLASSMALRTLRAAYATVAPFTCSHASCAAPMHTVAAGVRIARGAVAPQRVAPVTAAAIRWPASLQPQQVFVVRPVNSNRWFTTSVRVVRITGGGRTGVPRATASRVLSPSRLPWQVLGEGRAFASLPLQSLGASAARSKPLSSTRGVRGVAPNSAKATMASSSSLPPPPPPPASSSAPEESLLAARQSGVRRPAVVNEYKRRRIAVTRFKWQAFRLLTWGLTFGMAFYCIFIEDFTGVEGTGEHVFSTFRKHVKATVDDIVLSVTGTSAGDVDTNGVAPAESTDPAGGRSNGAHE